MPTLLERRREEQYYLKAEQEPDGTVVLCIVNGSGDRTRNGNIFSVRPDGTGRLHEGINRDAARKAGVKIDNIRNDSIKVE